MRHAVIMAGGSGTRFWPASRHNRPKQFLSLASDVPLVRQTFERVAPLVGAENTWIVTTAGTAELTRKIVEGIPPENVLAEPMGRDTAACAGYASHALLNVDPEAVCLVLPADHVISDEDLFRASLTAGADHVEASGGLLTFGIRPTSPETGYGYLEIGDVSTTIGDFKVHHLARFVEKPNAATARTYVEGGQHLWNAGIFAWRASDFLTEIRRQLPLLADGLAVIRESLGGPDAEGVLNEVYPTLPRISLDFGVMENAEVCWTVPVAYPWSDVGSWPALREVLTADEHGNVERGKVLSLDSSNNIVVSEGPVISVIGLKEIIVVATPDGVLVADKDQAQRVKEVVATIKERGWHEVL